MQSILLQLHAVNELTHISIKPPKSSKNTDDKNIKKYMLLIHQRPVKISDSYHVVLAQDDNFPHQRPPETFESFGPL